MTTFISTVTCFPHTRRRVLVGFLHRSFTSSKDRSSIGDKTPTGLCSATANEETLEWEKFEFSANPKWDGRFGESFGSFSKLLQETGDFNDLRKREALADEHNAKKLHEQEKAWQQLSSSLVEEATKVLEPYVNPTRQNKLQEIFSKRTRQTRFIFENPTNPSNVWACLRTIDSFGIQHVDIVVDNSSPCYEGKSSVVQKRGMRTAMGSAKWLSLRTFSSAQQIVQNLKEKYNNNIIFYAADLQPDKSMDIRDVTWKYHDIPCGGSTSTSSSHDEDAIVCIVMGNELIGISQEMRDLVDVCFTLPMCGFAESFNLSVATAITLAHMSSASFQNEDGPLRPGNLDPHELNCLKFKAYINSLSQRQRLGRALLKKAGVEIPQSVLDNL